MPSELMLTLMHDGVIMVIVAAGLPFTEQFRVAFSPTTNVRVVTLLLNFGASEFVGVR